MRSAFLALPVLLCAAVPTIAQAQSFGVGGRMSMIRGDVDADTDAERFTGGHIRARMSPRTALEVSLERRTETNLAGTERIRETPLQASLLLFPVRTVVAPYVLGGGGWYSNRVEQLEASKAVSSESTRKFGWHGGFGAELKLGKHAGAHADYRYTFLDFGDDDDADPAAAARGESRLLGGVMPSYKGSMWTAGLTLYF